MMLFILIIYTLSLIGFSSSNQCPSSKYCTCSEDLTIIKCTNRQLTNELLLNLNNQLPNSTIVLNLSSNILTSIKSLSNLNSLQILDLSSNKIRYIPSNIFSKFPQLTSLYIQNNSIKNLFNHFLQITPQQSQIVYENDQFIFNCSANSKHYWTFNQQFYPSTIISPSYSTILIHHLQINHSGIWTCHNDNFNRSISLTVLKNSSNQFCQSIQMNTSKGYFYWPRTLVDKTIEQKCSFGFSAGVSRLNEYPRAWYTCSSNGEWKNLDISECGFGTNISRIFDRLSLDETNLLLYLVKYLSKINRNDMKLDDIILLIDLIDQQQEKSINQDRIMLIYHLTDFILQIKYDYTLINQYQVAITRLRLIIERLLDLTTQSWLYIGKELTAMTIQSPLSSTLCFVPNRSLLTIICDNMNTPQQQSQLATIQFPFHSNQTNQYSLFRIIVYRQSILFISNKTKNNQKNPVIYIRPVSRNNFSTIDLTFSNQSNEISIGIWDRNLTSWEIKSSICKKNKNFISTNCILYNNNSFSITYLNNKKIFFNKKYSQLIISISSIIASICFLISILFYIYFHKINQIPKHFFHCLINYWFNLAILFPLFAFGIQLIQYPFLCQLISISLQYLCLTTILWLTFLTYAIWRRLYVISTDNGLAIKELKSKSILHYYIIAYGIALIICGINVIILREQYMINKICFLNNFDSLLILIIPLLIFIFLILIFLLIARNYIKNLSKLPSNHQILLNINLHHSYSLDLDNQYQSINHLLSILSQLILLIFLFLSSLSIYFHPLNSFKFSFEHIIYSHIYGFFLLFLAFYILSFYIFSRYDLIKDYYYNKKTDNQSISSNNSMLYKHYDIPSSIEEITILPQSYSHNLSNKHICEDSLINDDHECSGKRLTNITSKYYISYDQNLSENILNDTMPISSSDSISQEIIDSHRSSRNSFYERISKRSINIPIESQTIPTKNIQLHLSRSFPQSPISPSQAIIRPLPIIRLSLQPKENNLSNSMNIIDRDSSPVTPSSSPEEYYVIKPTDHLIQPELSNEKFSTHNKSPFLYIDDEDDERSVSLKSSVNDFKILSCTISTKKNRSQTLSSSSSSSNCSNDFYTNQIKLHESSV